MKHDAVGGGDCGSESRSNHTPPNMGASHHPYNQLAPPTLAHRSLEINRTVFISNNVLEFYFQSKRFEFSNCHEIPHCLRSLQMRIDKFQKSPQDLHAKIASLKLICYPSFLHPMSFIIAKMILTKDLKLNSS